jgi:lipopolysaccharide transport system ATP-binding protein
MAPDILLVDEVLAVGDLKFQRKCMEHAKTLRDRDATVLLVSHNMFAVKTVCDRAICLSHGRVVFDGDVEDAVALYEKESRLTTLPWAEGGIFKEQGQPLIVAAGIETLDEGGAPRTLFDHGERMRVRIRYEASRPLHKPNFIVALIRSDNVACCNFNTVMDGLTIPAVVGRGAIELLTPPLRLVSENYVVHLLVRDEGYQRLYCAQVGPTFHVRHALLSTHFGVYHEKGEWSVAGEDCSQQSADDRPGGLPFDPAAVPEVVGAGSQAALDGAEATGASR